MFSLKQTFHIIWIFTEGDGIKSRLPFKISSTLIHEISSWKKYVQIHNIFDPMFLQILNTNQIDSDFKKGAKYLSFQLESWKVLL